MALIEPDMRPAYEGQVARILSEAAERNIAVEVVGNGSKRAIGRAQSAGHALSTRLMRGVTLYEPAEMVMSARTGTPLVEIEAALARQGQMLAFEPIETAALTGGGQGLATIGGVFATNFSGARRITSGAARDHILGVQAVTGRGEIFKSGGRVMKNVTGYDLAKLATGSWGTLCVMTEVTFRVLPKPPATGTVFLTGLPDEIAVEVLCQAMGTPYEITGATHIQAALVGNLELPLLKAVGKSITALRIEAAPASIEYRKGRLAELFRAYGKLEDLDQDYSFAFWGELRRLTPFANGAAPLWRISTAPMNGPKVFNAIKGYMDARAIFDWSGGLLWVEVLPTSDAGAADIRRVIARFGGHATLVRADAAVRAAVDTFHPLEPGVLALTQKLKATFDPAGILSPGRMHAGH